MLFIELLKYIISKKIIYICFVMGILYEEGDFMLYPLQFQPVYKKAIWGGRKFEELFGRKIPEGRIAESWEVVCRHDEMSIVSNGALEGIPFSSLIEQYGENILGSSIYKGHRLNFPLLLKLIDANDRLSVQVHPDDNYAGIHHNDSGKNELWYIIDSKPGAKIIYGFSRDVSKEEFLNSVRENRMESFLNVIPAVRGEALFIPSGTVHAILGGSLIAEIQQNSNITYRIYDWGRLDSDGNPRELHIENAVDVINYKRTSVSKVPADIYNFRQYSIKTHFKTKYFSLDEVIVSGNYQDNADGSRFFIYMAVKGSGSIEHESGLLDINSGDTVFIPACLGKYAIHGLLTLLKIYI